MNLAELSLRNRTTTLVLTVVLFVGGIQAYQNLSRLEDPEFTIKDALIFTPYPGATAAEVEEEVSDQIEQAIQQLGQLDWIESTNYRGLSEIKAHIKDKYDRQALPQVWDELRRKVNDVLGKLPPGAGPSLVNDDFGDVWGVFVAVYGEEYTPRELKEVAKLLRKELLLVQDVAKIDFWGAREEAVYVEPNRERLSQLGIQPETIASELRNKNMVSDAGRVNVAPQFLPIEPTGLFESEREFLDLLISGASGRQIYLRDLADVKRSYVDPPDRLLRYDGQSAIGLGISTLPGGNVVEMGEAIYQRSQELLSRIPLGIDIGLVSLQSEAVVTAIDGFLESLIQAVAIVVGVLLLFMGLRSGLIIGFILALTITGTFIFMGPWGVALERISLGALIIALGMLVDNAIVVVDGMLVRIQGGQDPEQAASDIVAQQSLPLLGATAVAIMAFAAIGLSEDSTGEYCRSLFRVVCIALGLSWITAVTVTPVLCVMFLKRPDPKDGEADDPYGGRFYGAYRNLLSRLIRLRLVTIGAVVAAFAVSLWGFQYVDNSFFPDSTRPQFMVDMWLPQGTDIRESERQAEQVENFLREQDGVTHVTTCVGGGAMRFLLTYDPEKGNSSYVQFLVDVDDYQKIAGLVEPVEAHIAAAHPDAVSYVRLFRLGPGAGGRIQAKFMGPDSAVLRQLADRAEAIIQEDGGAKGVRIDWRQPVMTVRPLLAERESNAAGIERQDVSATVRAAFEGERVGTYREHDELLPIFVRAPEIERMDVAQLNSIQIWSPAASKYIPMRQVVSGFDTTFENDLTWRMNRKRAITVHADPKSGTPAALLDRIKPRIEALTPEGYELEFWGEYRDSRRSQAGLAASIPFFLAMMILIVIALFNALRQPLIIWLVVPLALIGVTIGLLLTGQPFGFMSLLGFMSLSGMLIKNAIVLIDEIEAQKKVEGQSVYDAIVVSGVSRLRPIAMAALTTALGMLPLLLDAFFVAMAVTIIFGLMIATVLTTVLVPVLYATFFRVSTPGRTP